MRRSINHCIIDYDERRGRLRVRGLTALGSTIDEYRIISNSSLVKACDDYWKFVNVAIVSMELTGLADTLDSFYDQLKTRGNTLCRLLMDAQTRHLLWSLARQSDVLILHTGLLQIPWEALFNEDPDVRSFLGHECVLARFPEKTTASGGRTVKRHPNFTGSRIVMIDKVLAEMKNGEVGIVETFERDGEEVVVTNTLGALVERTQSVRMIHWICEHEPNRGLRLREGLHYTSDDAFTHVFAAGSVLMITSCQAAAGDPLHSNIAARICVASNCTVIAPSSLIAMRVGVEFARRLNTVISAHSAGPLNVADLWKRVQGTFKHKLPHPASLSAEKCFALWYGIYGNAENLVRN